MNFGQNTNTTISTRYYGYDFCINICDDPLGYDIDCMVFRKIPLFIVEKNDSSTISLRVNNSTSNTNQDSTGNTYRYNINVLNDFSILSNKASIKSVNLPYINNISMSSMFYGCSNLLYASFFTGKTTSLYNAFKDTKINTINLEAMDLSGCTSMYQMNHNNSSCRVFLGNDLDVSNVTSFAGAFYYNTNLQVFDARGWTNSVVTSAGRMFQYCSKLTSIDLRGVNLANVAALDYMFQNCSNLTSINLAATYTTTTLTGISYMFYNCSKLRNLIIGNLDLSRITASGATSMNYVFYNCSNLTITGTISNLGQNTTSVNVAKLSSGYTTTLTFVNGLYDRTGTTRGVFTYKNTGFTSMQNTIITSLLTQKNWTGALSS